MEPIEIVFLVPWPDGESVTVGAFFGFIPGHPMLVVHTGKGAWAALTELWAQAATMSKATAFARN